MIMQSPTAAAHAEPAEVLAEMLANSSSVQPQARGNSQVRFWWPPKGTKDPAGADLGVFRAVSTGVRSDKITRERKKELIKGWILKNGVSPLAKPKPGDAGIEDEIALFIQERYIDTKRPEGTIRPIRQALRKLAAILKAGIPAKGIPPIVTVPGITAAAWHAAVPALKLRELAPRPGQGPEIKPKAWKNLFGNIHPFIEWEITRKNLHVDPTLGTITPTKAELKESRPVRTVWPEAEFEMTLAKISFREVALQNGAGNSTAWVKLTRTTLKVLRWGGVDVNEVYRIRANHIEEDSKGKLWIKKRRGKSKSGMEMIKLPVSSKVEKEVRALWIDALSIAPDAVVFPWATRFSTFASFTSWLYKAVQKARKRAGLPPRDNKSFRHTFTTHHLKMGKVKISQLKEWLGHADDSLQIHDTYDLTEFDAEAMD